MNNVLPPGIWDNPTSDEMTKYLSFLDAWNLNEEEYLKHYQEWLSGQDVLAAFSYLYDQCGDCTTQGSRVGDEIVFISPIDEPYAEGGSYENDFGSNYGNYHVEWCGHLHFGYSFLIAINPSWQHVQGWAIFRFSDSEIPVGSRVKYAFLRMWPDSKFQSNVYWKKLCYNTGILNSSEMPSIFSEFCEKKENMGEPWPLNFGNVGKTENFCVGTCPPDWGGVLDIFHAWEPGIPYDSTDITCLIHSQLNSEYLTDENINENIIVIVGPPLSETGYGETVYYKTDHVELGIYIEYPISSVVCGGTADNEILGVIEEYMQGGVLVGGASQNSITEDTDGGAKTGGVVRQFLFYTATGGVTVQRPDVELHLDFNVPDDSTAQDISSHERHAILVNMSSSNFLDGRKANNKIIDFEA